MVALRKERRSAPSLPTTKPPEQFPVPALGFLLTVIFRSGGAAAPPQFPAMLQRCPIHGGTPQGAPQGGQVHMRLILGHQSL